ncbi:MAG: hypothetical protein J6X05_07640 [Bacteroidales bacterium]|nr:hypothetical protein [Bacteroidales bacterium]
MKIKYLMAGALLALSLTAKSTADDNRLSAIPNSMETSIINGYDYAKAWKEVDKYDSDRQPSMALNKVKEIRENALKESNYQQVSRAFIYIIDYTIQVGEDNQWKEEIKLLKKTSFEAPEAPRAFLNFLLGRYYQAYKEANSFRFRNRTDVENDQSDDMETWSLERLNREISTCYRNAVSSPHTTQRTPLSQWNEAIATVTQRSSGNITCTNLYDFIAWGIIENYCNRTNDNSDFSHRDIELVSDATKFMNFKPTNTDTWSIENFRLELYQELLRSHQNDKTPLPYVFTDLYRLSYYNTKSVNENAPETYLKVLESMKNKYPNDPELAPAIAFHIAEAYKKQNRLKEAHNIAAETFKKFPKSTTHYSEACDALAKQLEIKRLYFYAEEYVPEDSPFVVNINYTNIPKLYLHIYSVTNLEAYKHNTYDRVEYIQKNLTEIKQQTIDLIDNHDYKNLNSEFILDGLPYGHYVILGSNDQNYIPNKSDVVAYLLVHSTNINVVSQLETFGRKRYYVLNRTTGRAILDAKVSFYSNERLIDEQTTDNNGTVLFDLKKLKSTWGHNVTVTTNDGKTVEFDNYSSYHTEKNNAEHTSAIFTDRKIYRPGQKVYYKVIIYNTDHKQADVIPNHKTTIEFLDVNTKVIAINETRTNEFGSVHGEFTIPVGLANGKFFIHDTSTGDFHVINVEEYKRPTFEVKMETAAGEIKLNDKITVTGNAATYAGTKVSGAKVRYEVTRIPEWRGWWFWNNRTSETVIETGETTTDDDGNFSISFTAKPDVNAKNDAYLVYNYRTTVHVTDVSGETRDASRIVSAGYRSMFISTSLPTGFQVMEKTKLDSIKIYSESVNGSPINANLSVKISRLQNFDKPRMAKHWSSCNDPLPWLTREMWDSKIPNTEFSLSDNNLDSLSIQKAIKTVNVKCDNGEGILDLQMLKKEGSGHYLVVISGKDREGRAVEYKRRFTLYSPNDKITDINRVFFFNTEKSSYQPGETAIVNVGSALENLIVRYQVKLDDEILQQGTLSLSKSVEKITVPIKENMRGGITVMMFFMKNNHFEYHSENINIPYTNKQLNVKFETFRDRLYPGDTETWKIRITDYNKKPIRAEFAATLFDASLNTLAPNSWYMNPYYGNSSYYNFSPEVNRTTSTAVFTSDNNRGKYVNISTTHPSLNWFGHAPRFGRRGFYDEQILYSVGAVNERSIQKNDIVVIEDHKAVMDDVAFAEEMEDEEIPITRQEAMDFESGDFHKSSNEPDFSNAEIRTNFAETAFFKPDIVTDYNGDLFVEFTVPQSITRWKMLGIAHTKDMAVGTITNELVTNKDFSIIPNLPRFMRCGDSIEIPVKISNLGDNDVVRGQIKMEVLDVETMRPIKGFKIWEPLQAFEVFKGKTESTKYVVEVPQYEKPVAIRIVGVSGVHSDGEQHIVPILTDKTLVTEAMTLSVRGNETKTFEFKSWTNNNSTTAIDHSLTLEYSSNPAWYAVSSLPWLSQNPYECFEQTFSKLFANSVSELIIDNNPAIPSILSGWLAKNSQALTSPLLKNQELKNLLIDETPWAIDGENETERMHNLCNLLDEQRIVAENEKFIKKLVEGQLSSGAWPWFAGMHESPWITQHITAGFGKLRHIGLDINKDPRITNMIDKSIRYLDEYTASLYDEIKRLKQTPGFFGFQYLYMRSFFPEYKLTRAKEVYDYTLQYAKDHWQELGLYYQAVLCTVMKRTGNNETAQKIIASLKDRARKSDEFGMFFNENVNGFLWHENNIETQSVIIEAFDEMGMKDEVEELKIWLIKNRQSNRWSTTKATTEACYAMFLCGNQIEADEPLCKIIIGGKKADTKDAEAGTGYFKQSWQGREMNKSMAKITVSNPNNHISYGAVYRQYFEDMDKVVAADNKLQIDKKMFLQAKGDNGKTVLREITAGSEVHPGDRVTVRFIIRTDRDLDYVHLKDMRAAGFEPLNVISRTKFQDGMMYYESTKDASENFFIEHLDKGTYVFEYPLIAVHVGDFTNGIATIQCMYAPEFTAHSAGMRFKIVK